MKRKIANQFLINYILMFIISIIIGIFGLIIMDFANHLLSETLVKNNYTAESLMKDDYNTINTTSVIESGGGVQVVNNDYEVVFSSGLNTITKNKLTQVEFMNFLMETKSKGIPYSYSIEYNSKEQFWLIVTFPTSFRIDFAIVHNKEFSSVDKENVIGIIVAIILLYLILLAISTLIYSKISSISIINPLRKLSNSTKRLRDGDYSERVDLNLKNEFLELQDTFNSMAQQIEQEIALRKQTEESRRKLVLDISHDLKNPLASIMGYAELYRNKLILSEKEKDSYINIIYENSKRANNLISNLFDLSKMESTEFMLYKTKVDICEYMREEMGKAVLVLDKTGFTYDFYIPEKEIYTSIDTRQMDRVVQNLFDNTLQYNSKGTKVIVRLYEEGNEVVIIFKDDGIGIPKKFAKDIFQPFVRTDISRNSQTGGTGLGLAIVKKIIEAHDGNISLITDKGHGCKFTIRIPKI